MINRLTEERLAEIREEVGLFQPLYQHVPAVALMADLLAEVDALRQERTEAQGIAAAAIQEAKELEYLLREALLLLKATFPAWSSSWPTKPGFYWYQASPEAALEVVAVEIEPTTSDPLMRRLNRTGRHFPEDQAQWAGPLAARSPEVSND